jgi:alkylation response protein AidB-like acyl-CoA dehydrogenase
MDFSLSENQRKWQLIAREFATKIVAPEALSRDRIPLAKDRIPWDWIKLADEAGIRTLGVPKKIWGRRRIYPYNVYRWRGISSCRSRFCGNNGSVLENGSFV